MQEALVRPRRWRPHSAPLAAGHATDALTLTGGGQVALVGPDASGGVRGLSG